MFSSDKIFKQIIFLICGIQMLKYKRKLKLLIVNNCRQVDPAYAFIC